MNFQKLTQEFFSLKKDFFLGCPFIQINTLSYIKIKKKLQGGLSYIPFTDTNGGATSWSGLGLGGLVDSFSLGPPSCCSVSAIS